MPSDDELSLASRLGPPSDEREEGGCTMYVWRPHPRVIVVEPRGTMDGPITEWGLGQMSTVRDHNLAQGQKSYVIWNLARVKSYTTAVRRLCIEWFRAYSKDLNRHVVLLPRSSLVRMAVSIAGALGVELTRHMYGDQATFLRTFEETMHYLEQRDGSTRNS